MHKIWEIVNLIWNSISLYWPALVFILGFFFTKKLRNKKSAIVIPLPDKKELVIEEEGAFDEATQTSEPISPHNLITTLSQSEAPVLDAPPAVVIEPQAVEEAPLASLSVEPSVKKKVLNLTGIGAVTFSKKAQSFVGGNSSSVIIDNSGTIKNRSQLRTNLRMGSRLL